MVWWMVREKRFDVAVLVPTARYVKALEDRLSFGATNVAKIQSCLSSLEFFGIFWNFFSWKVSSFWIFLFIFYLFFINFHWQT